MFSIRERIISLGVLSYRGTRHLNDIELSEYCSLSGSSEACTEERSIGMTRLREVAISYALCKCSVELLNAEMNKPSPLQPTPF